jgi:hypothetical protein
MTAVARRTRAVATARARATPARSAIAEIGSLAATARHPAGRISGCPPVMLMRAQAAGARAGIPAAGEAGEWPAARAARRTAAAL